MSKSNATVSIVARLGRLRPLDPDDAALLDRIAERGLNRDDLHGISADVMLAYRAGYARALGPAFAALTPDALYDATVEDEPTDPQPTLADGTPRVDAEAGR